MSQRQLKLGAILIGVGTTQNGWRDPDLPGDANIDIDWYRRTAQRAEAEKLDFVFIVDSPYITPDTAPHLLNRLEPLTLLSALASATTHIGLIATLTASYNEPFNVARQFASLDLISGGRAGWNLVTTGLEGAAKNYGREEHFEHTLRYRRAHEHLQVVRGLWDSYEDDAFPRDKASGVFLDKHKLHALNHRGEFFSVAGPLNISRSPQGQPVIFQAGSSQDGRELAARVAEGIFATSESFEDARDFYRDIKHRVAAAGRDPEHVLIMPALHAVLAPTDEEARRRDEQERAGLDLKKALVQLGRPFNYHDFTQYPLDEPFPELGDLGSNGYRGHAEQIKRVAREQGLTLRETAWRFGVWRSSFVGSPRTIADEIQRWFEQGAADGFIYHGSSPADQELFFGQVVPLLRERGLFRSEYTASTLRGHLGLAVPENRHTRARHDAELAEPEAAVAE